MKSFIIALILMAAVIFGVILNCIYINNVNNRLLSYADEVENAEPIYAEETIKALDEYWKSEKLMLNLVVPYSQSDRVDDYIDSLLAAVESQNKVEYKKALKLLRSAAEEISRLEKFSLSNIF